MIGYKAFVIYDSLYEEYQTPFFIKNENIAKIEFEAFVRDMVDKAPEKEKVKTSQRFHLYTFDLFYDKEDCSLFSIGDAIQPTVKIKAEPVDMISEDSDNE